MKKLFFLAFLFLFSFCAKAEASSELSGGGGGGVSSGGCSCVGSIYLSGDLTHSHLLALKPGWSVFSVPRIVESHEFSVAETSQNFDVFLLDNSKPSGWATMSDLGQTEFTPLYGYFINNKTTSTQYILVNYKKDVEPNNRLFSRSLSVGWNVVGVANPEYSLGQKYDNFFDSNNLSNVFSSFVDNIDLALDFTAGELDASSVFVSNEWASKTEHDLNGLRDVRETKAYAVYLNNADIYNGYQNNDKIEICNNPVFSGEINVSSGNMINNPAVGEKSAVLASIKLKNSSNFKATVKSLTFKRSAGTATDDDFENVSLYANGIKVASSNGIKDKFVTFVFNSPTYNMEIGQETIFDVKADIVDGAGKTITLSLDSLSDVVAMNEINGEYINIVGSYFGTSLIINSGYIALTKENSVNDKVRKDTTNVVLGTVKITPTTGKNVELSTFAVTIAFTGTGSSSIENVEIMDKSTGNVYDLSEVHGTTVKYRNTAVDMTLTSGVTKEFVVRADVKAGAAANDTYTVSVAASDLTIKDLDNNVITDKTPSTLSLSAVTVQAPALTVSTNALSSSLNAVVGTSNVQVLSLNFKANTTDALKITEVSIMDEDANGGSAVSTAMISQYRLYKDGVATPISTKSGSRVTSGERVTFDALDINVPKGEEVKYYVTIDLVNDNSLNGQSTKWGIVDFAAEDATEGESIATSTAFTAGADSGRTVEIVGAGSLVVEMDNSNTDTQKDKYEVAGNSTGLLAAIKVRGANENITIEDLRIKVLDASAASSTNANSIFSKLQIVDSDKTTVLKEISNVTAETLIEDINVVIPQSSKTIYLKGVLNPIGKDWVGVNNAAVFFGVDGIVAKGIDSNQALSASSTSLSSKSCDAGDVCYVSLGASFGNSTGYSKEIDIVASRISSIELVMNGCGQSVSSSLSTGSNNVAIIKISTDGNNNTLSTGDDVKTILNRIRADATLSDVSIDKWSINRCGGAEGDSITIGMSSANGTKNIPFDIDKDWQLDNLLAKQSTVYYVIRVNINNLSATAGASSVQIDLNNLDTGRSGDQSVANFVWQGSLETERSYYMWLPTNKISGVKISN